MTNTFSKLFISLACLNASTNILSACADKIINCRDRTEVRLNMHYVASKASCVPLESGGGNSLDLAIKFCESHGGLPVKNIPEAPIEWINNFLSGHARDYEGGFTPIY